eukprot:gnl/TRDRNA2_/TRDRNA2_204336_c0_seq1.p1 gnl/TRDRNA2_/TRDRNA2_204336_c0~~gnl/TRDRNA2_/TRDRNA2_204336_c0_seq1.p1  ORF type:complete len:131 (+),score=21.76 gnl/TRDRNA2_/TRDRNA2_204336_c0_seq1:101-493(+)
MGQPCCTPQKICQCTVGPRVQATASVSSHSLNGTGKMVLGFLKPDGQLQEVEFTTQPVGIGFGNAAPLVVGGIMHGSAAQVLGVQPGWCMLTVNGMFIEDMPLTEQLQVLKATSALLPRAEEEFEVVIGA